MNSRLSQIVAASIGPDGKPDRGKIFHDLQTTPDAPEAILIDAFVSTDEALRLWRADASKIEASLVAAVVSSTDTGLTNIRTEAAHLVTAASALSDRVIRIAFVAGVFTGGTVGAICTWLFLRYQSP